MTSRSPRKYACPSQLPVTLRPQLHHSKYQMIVKFPEPGPLGFTLSADSSNNNYVSHLVEGGFAEKAKIRVGDRVESVMGISVAGRSFDDVIEFIRLVRASGDVLRIQFSRGPNNAVPLDAPPL